MGHGGHHVMIHNWQRPRGLTLLLPDLVCMKRIPFLDLLETRGSRENAADLYGSDEDGWMWAS